MKKLILPILLIIGIFSSYAQQKENPFLWKKANTTIKLYGFVRVVASADFNGSISNNDFNVSSIPVPQPWDNNGRFAFDASTTRVGLEVTQDIANVGNLKFGIEGDFRGANDVIRLRQAYVSFLGFTIGQVWSIMYDPMASAPTIDFKGINSRTFFRDPQINYAHSFYNGISVCAAAELPSAKITTVTGVKSETQRIPDFPLYVQYKNGESHVRLSGIMRGLSFGDTEKEKIETKLGWGVQLSGSLKVLKPITLYAQGIYGEGIGRYISDLSIMSVDLMPDYNSKGNMMALPMYGFSFGTRIDFTKKWYMSANFSTAGMSDKENYTHPDDYHKGTYVSGSIFWNAFKNMTAGAEYLYGKREDKDEKYGEANRVQMMVRYDF